MRTLVENRKGPRRKKKRWLVRLRKFLRAIIYPFRGKSREAVETYLQR